MNEQFADNPDYREYERLLLRLARLMAEGKGDADEADQIREAMDGPWYRLSEPERSRLDGLSGDLFMLSGAEAYEMPREAAPDPDVLKAQVEAAHARHDWLAVLSFLRQGPISAPMQIVAAVRSQAYEALGHLEPALAFAEHGASLDVGSSYFPTHIMTLLWRIGRVGEAYGQALGHVRSSRTNTDLLVSAALLLLILQRSVAVEEARRSTALIVRQLDKRLKRESPRTQFDRVIAATGFFALGIAYETLNDPQRALKVYSTALIMEPADEAILLSRGLLRFKLGLTQEARSDFESAVRGHSQYPLPYAVLARMSLDEGDYRRCIELCDLLTYRLNDHVLLAVVLQWKAIAEQHLGMSRQQVIGTLEVASELDPSNTIIASDLQSLKQRTRNSAAADASLLRSDITLEQLERLSPRLESRLPMFSTPTNLVAVA